MALEPTKRATQGAPAKVDKSGYPKILVPTPAQLAAGVRVVVAEPETWCRSVAGLVRKAQRCGWEVSVSYSHFIDTPPNMGKWKGQPVPKHSQAVRLRNVFGIQAYGIWHGIEGEGWAAESAQAQWRGLRSLPFGAEALEKLVTGKMMLIREPGQGAWRLEAVIV